MYTYLIEHNINVFIRFVLEFSLVLLPRTGRGMVTNGSAGSSTGVTGFLVTGLGSVTFLVCLGFRMYLCLD